MPELVEPLGHAEVVAGLLSSARQQKLPHAILLEGEEGIGKYRVALWLAAALLCERGGDAPCLECGSCKRVKSGAHADVFIIDHRAEGQNSITIDFMTPREGRPKDGYQGEPVESFLALRAAEGRGKYIIVREAEAMLEEAQNAFLKMLEEPRPGVHLFLETSSKSSLLATVRSRVVPVRLMGLSRSQCEDVLWRDGGLSPSKDEDTETVARLVRLSGGSPGLAMRLHQRAAPQMQVLLGEGMSGKRPASETAAELFDLDGDFPGKTAAAQRRTRARMILDLGLEILVDVERVLAGVSPGDLAHGEVAVPIAERDVVRSESVRRFIGDAWLSAREDLGLNLTPEGLVDRALLAFSNCQPAHH